MLKQVQHDGILDKEPKTWMRSDQRVFVLKRAAALSKDGYTTLGEGPRTAFRSAQRIFLSQNDELLLSEVHK